MSYRLGVDVGGTFTDFLLINESDGSTHTAKVPSTPDCFEQYETKFLQPPYNLL